MRKLLSRPLRVILFVALCALAAAPRLSAQQTAPAPDPSAERGVRLFELGEWKGAAKEFRSALKRRKDDPLLWLYLGQSLFRNGDMKDARKAYDTALRLKPDYADAHASLAYLLLVSGNTREAEAEARRALAAAPDSADARYVLGQLRAQEGAWLKALAEADAIIAVAPNSAAAHLLRTQALLGLYERGNAIISDERRGVYDFDEKTVAEARAAQSVRLREAAESFEKYARLSPNSPEAAEMREQLESLRFYAEAAASTDPARKLYPAAETTTRAVITAKPEPGYTEAARNANVRGVVRLRAVLDADGAVRHILVLKSLSHGLTQKSVAAARGIRFKPATVNGVPVAQVVMLEYNFNIY